MPNAGWHSPCEKAPTAVCICFMCRSNGYCVEMISTNQLKKILKDTSLGPTWSRETAETLKAAVKECDEEILLAVLSLDVDINFEFRGGDTLLSLIIRYANTTNWTKTAQLLIEK